MIRDALAAGAEVYDLRGITDTLDADDPHVGLIQFKVGTGGEAVEYAGEWDLPLNRLLYKAFELYLQAAVVSTDEPDPHASTATAGAPTSRDVAAATPGLVPVVKGNGYGFSLGRLARSATWLGVDTVAVGTYAELPEVATRFPGDLLVLTPVASRRPPRSTSSSRPRPAACVHTVSRLTDLTDLLDRVRTPGSCSSGRPACCATACPRPSCARPATCSAERRRGVDGVALHLPLAHGSHVTEVHRLLDRRGRGGPRTRRPHHLGQPPDRAPSSTGCARSTPTTPSGRGSAPTCGWATGPRCG